SAHLVVLPANGNSFTAELAGDVTRIGSGRDAHVRIADPELSGVHAEVQQTPLGMLLVRHASPLEVNGKKVRQHPLAPFDLITLGRPAISSRPGPAPVAAAELRTAPAGDGALSLLSRLADLTRRIEGQGTAQEMTQDLLADVLSLVGGTYGAVVRLAGDD